MPVDQERLAQMREAIFEAVEKAEPRPKDEPSAITNQNVTINGGSGINVGCIHVGAAKKV